MTKSFKMVVLEVLLEADALATGLPLEEIARRSHAVIKRSPELMRDLDGVAGLSDPVAPPVAEWLSYWRKNPIAAWTQGQGWFAIEGDRFVPRRLAIPGGLESAVNAMTRELVDYRLARYRTRAPSDLTGTTFSCTVTWNQRDPILKLPRRSGDGEYPSEETDVRLPDGSVWRFRFAKEFCNVARPIGTARNRLPDLMRRWFGPAAGHPGTRFRSSSPAHPTGGGWRRSAR